MVGGDDPFAEFPVGGGADFLDAALFVGREFNEGQAAQVVLAADRLARHDRPDPFDVGIPDENAALPVQVVHAALFPPVGRVRGGAFQSFSFADPGGAVQDQINLCF